MDLHTTQAVLGTLTALFALGTATQSFLSLRNGKKLDAAHGIIGEIKIQTNSQLHDLTARVATLSAALDAAMVTIGDLKQERAQDRAAAQAYTTASVAAPVPPADPSGLPVMTVSGPTVILPLPPTVDQSGT